ncbi:MAG TPA: MBL fold metallo-hydrolase, partial [Acidimicrobiia bacterium]|nr:MBL fold metallo-hydrolase [Acidimicrobiia bacterium]
MARRWIALAVPAIALAAGLFIPPLVSRSVVADDEVVRWTMVDVSEGDRQGDAHLIEFATTTVLIDTGLEDLARSRLLPVLEQRDVSRIDHLFISHAHRDHYGGLIVLADSGVELGTVYFHKPDPAICKREVPWGCDAAEIDRYTSALRERGVRFGDAVNGMAVDVGSTASLTVLYAYDGGPGSPLRNIDVNDTSLIMRLDVGDVSALFTGDLNRKFGTFLASADLELRSRRLLKVPHHGAEGV